ncbi:MAG: NAD(+) synthase [Cytophagales bacterium]|nr:MAG: NAD(+) synthase [Cytophagales bacterium]
MKLKIGGAALNQTPMDWANNTNNIIQAIEAAKKEGIHILCLPELCVTGYGCEDVFLSEWIKEAALDQLFQILPYTSNIAVAIGIPIDFENNLYNCACFVFDQKILGFCAKQFLANEGIHYETRWFKPWVHSTKNTIIIRNSSYPIGDLTFELFQIKIGFEICEDAWKSDTERPASRLKKQNVDLILNPSASHFSFGKSAIRYDLIIGSSKTFNCTYLYANLLGNEAGRIIYDGEVLIAHQGKLIQRNQRFSFKAFNLISTEINFQTNAIPQNILNPDTREKAYEFWEATSLGLFDYLRKSKSKAFVLSLSGGADSSACAIMVAEMLYNGLEELGLKDFLSQLNLMHLYEELLPYQSDNEKLKKNLMAKILICAYQATVNSSEDTYMSAKVLAESIGATFYHWNIDEQIKRNISTIEATIGRELTWHQDDIALQNIQARTRSPLIWLLTNLSSALLITTSNRSEGDVGYATMDGDTSGSIAPIAGVDKDFIRQWLKWVEKTRNHKGLAIVNNLSPSAELRPLSNTQTDEKDLMPYDILVKIERLAIRNRKSPIEVFEILIIELELEKNILKNYIIKFFQLWSRNQWKRERIAPSFHLDDFNVDSRSWCRFPILSGSFEQEILQLIND